MTRTMVDDEAIYLQDEMVCLHYLQEGHYTAFAQAARPASSFVVVHRRAHTRMPYTAASFVFAGQ